MGSNKNQRSDQLGWLSILLFILSLFVFGVIIADTFLELPQETSKLLSMMDFIICIFFFFDFIRNFYLADSKLSYMKWGWLDLLASIPMVDILRFGRLLRIIRVFRLIKAFRSAHSLIQHVYANKAKGTFNSVVILCVLLIMFGSISILQFENLPSSNIKTAEDAIYWAFVTVVTFGHENLYATTTLGRVVEGILIVSGMGLMGTFTAYVASWFLKPQS